MILAVQDGGGASEERSGRSVQGKRLALFCRAKSAPADSGRLVSWRSICKDRDSVRHAWRSTRSILPAADLLAIPIHATNPIRPENPIRSKPTNDSHSLAAKLTSFREPDPWQLGNVKDFQLLSVRVAARRRSVNTLIAKPTPAHC